MLSFILQIGNTVVATAVETIAAQPVTTGIETATELPPNHLSLFDMISKGGVIMIPLALLLLISIYVMIERALVISKAGKKNATLMPSLKDMISNGNLANARNLCKSVNSPESLMIEQGISRIGQNILEIREAMNKKATAELSHLEKNLGVLNIIGRIAPMFGFIGTIIGVIKIFYDISLTDNISIGVISTGLYQKMITSASGLVVGLLAFIGFYILNSMLDKTINKMESASVEFIDILHEPTK